MIKKIYGGRDPRLVINFSHSDTGGRHDGETELEAAIDELMQSVANTRRRRSSSQPETRFSTAGTRRFTTSTFTATTS